MMTVAGVQAVRVWVPDVWDVVRMQVTPDWTVARLKQEALRDALGREPGVEHYLVKYRGAAVLDESVTLADLDVPNEAPFIVLPVRRRPAR